MDFVGVGCIWYFDFQVVDFDGVCEIDLVEICLIGVS